jgi:hypothetical protein
VDGWLGKIQGQPFARNTGQIAIHIRRRGSVSVRPILKQCGMDILGKHR